MLVVFLVVEHAAEGVQICLVVGTIDGNRYKEFGRYTLEVVVRTFVDSHEDVEGWLRSFCSGDVNDIDFCKRLLETFVAKIDLTNEVAVIYYNISDKKKQKRTIPVCSDTARLLDTTKSYPNPGRPFVYHGYIVLIADLARPA